MKDNKKVGEMMKNKGYSLAELLISMAIFSVVMIGIITIMSNTMNAYNISSTDAELQEEAQILGNQLEEYLCEATDFSSNVVYNSDPEHADEVISSVYTFHSKGDDLELTYYNVTGELKLDNVLLAQNVNNFDINGFGEGDDNTVVIDMSLGDDYTYNFSRAIYLRNTPENSSINSIQTAISNMGGTPSPTPTTEQVFYVRRFDEINISSQFGISSIADPDGASGPLTAGGIFDNGTASDEYFTLTPATDLASNCYILKPTLDVNKNMGLTGSEIWGATHKITLVGYNSSNQKVTVKLDVDKVELVDSLIQFSSSQPNNSGIHNIVQVKGLNVYSALKNNCTETCKVYFCKGTVPKKAASQGEATFTFSLNQDPNYGGIDTLVDQEGNIAQLIYISDPNGRVKMLAEPDPFTGNIVVANGNDALTTTCSGLINKKDYTVCLEFNIIYKDSEGHVIKNYSPDKSYQLLDCLGTGLDLP